MKVLYVSALAPGKNDVSPFLSSQYNSLIHAGLDMHKFYYKGGGVKGYLKAIFDLNNIVKNGNFDIINAQYSYSGFICNFQKKVPVVTTMLGSDILNWNVVTKRIAKFAIKKSKHVIVRSTEMKKIIGKSSKVSIIPAGINFDKFVPYDKMQARKQLGIEKDKTVFLFPANPARAVKNYEYAKKLIENYKKLDENSILTVVKNCPQNKLYLWYNAADFILLTSHYEGFPNVIKEALACNKPVIVTKVGGLEDFCGHMPSCCLLDRNIDSDTTRIFDFAKNLKPYDSRKEIEWLDEPNIAKALIDVYEKAIKIGKS